MTPDGSQLRKRKLFPEASATSKKICRDLTEPISSPEPQKDTTITSDQPKNSAEEPILAIVLDEVDDSELIST